MLHIPNNSLHKQVNITDDISLQANSEEEVRPTWLEFKITV